jgi:hypothetical protein
VQSLQNRQALAHAEHAHLFWKLSECLQIGCREIVRMYGDDVEAHAMLCEE